MTETPISYEDIRDVIQKQGIACDEKYVLEKVFWQRCIKMGVTAISAFLALAVILIGWNFTMRSDIATNSESLKNVKERMTNIEYRQDKIIEKQDTILTNQEDVIKSSDNLSRKIDLLLRQNNK